MSTRPTQWKRTLHWSIYACTIFMGALIAVSIWIEPYTYRKSPTNAVGVARGYSLVLSDGVLLSAYWKELPTDSHTPASSTSGIGKHGALLPAWYAPPNFQPGYIKFPLAYPAALLLITSVSLAITNRRRQRPGHCPACGYDLSGIGTSPCPECGHGVNA